MVATIIITVIFLVVVLDAGVVAATSALDASLMDSALVLEPSTVAVEVAAQNTESSTDSRSTFSDSAYVTQQTESSWRWLELISKIWNGMFSSIFPQPPAPVPPTPVQVANELRGYLNSWGILEPGVYLGEPIYPRYLRFGYYIHISVVNNFNSTFNYLQDFVDNAAPHEFLYSAIDNPPYDHIKSLFCRVNEKGQTLYNTGHMYIYHYVNMGESFGKLIRSSSDNNWIMLDVKRIPLSEGFFAKEIHHELEDIYRQYTITHPAVELLYNVSADYQILSRWSGCIKTAFKISSHTFGQARTLTPGINDMCEILKDVGELQYYYYQHPECQTWVHVLNDIGHSPDPSVVYEAPPNPYVADLFEDTTGEWLICRN